MIRRENEQRTGLTNLKLQKLLYILYAKYHVEAKAPLFASRFEAWKYGPVLSEVYEIFKAEGANPITEYRPDANGKILVVVETGDFGLCFDYVWGNYARKSAAYLVDMTHGKVENHLSRETAWKHAVANGGIGAFIDDDEIKKDGEMWFAAR
jgi:uncharacterized phage-associated protein